MANAAEIVVIAGVTYSITDKYITKDIVTEEYIHIRNSQGNISNVISDLVVLTSNSREFNIENSSTYDAYRKVTGYTKHLDKTIEMVVCTAYLGPCIIYNTPEKVKEIITRLDLVQGENNPTIFYNKKEKSVMDKPQPYRKFNFTFNKLSLEDVVGRKLTPAELLLPDIKEVSKNTLKRNLDMGVESMTFKEFEGYRYTFGLELETCVGRFEDNEVRHLNLKAVHDGSLREADGSNPIGGEYVTGVLTGDSGLAQLHEICRVLQTKCQVDKRCGVHAHIGSLNWNKEDIVYSYILAEIIEKELFQTLPKSRRKNSYCRSLEIIIGKRVKELNETKSVSQYNILINELYDLIFANVSGLPASDKRYNRNTNHPKGSKCGYDKNSQRYSWLNYVTLMFDTKGIPNSHTLEFRPMSGTLNYTKIKNWLKVCISFCAFVENHKSIIRNSPEKIDLSLMISKTFPKTGARLISYMDERKATFSTNDETIDYKTDKNINKKSIKEVACAQ